MKPTKTSNAKAFVELAQRSGMPIERVGLIVTGYQNKIISQDQDSVAKFLLIEVRKIAAQYGGRIDGLTDVIQECVTLTIRNFNLLGVQEIREAFRAYTAGELDINAEVYGGVFNVAVFGKVLSGWVDYRKKVIAAYLNDLQEQKMHDYQQKKAEYLKEKHDKEFPQWIEKGRAEYTTWEDVPEWFYQTAFRLGMLKFKTGEAQRIYEEAKKIAAIQKEQERGEQLQMNAAKRLMYQGFDVEARAKVIARKMSVFKKLIQN